MGIKTIIRNNNLVQRILYDRRHYAAYSTEHSNMSKIAYYRKVFPKTTIIGLESSKAKQFDLLVDKLQISPIENPDFFYSLDRFTCIQTEHRIFDNYSIDYNNVVNNDFSSILNTLKDDSDEFTTSAKSIVNSLHKYYLRCMQDEKISEKYNKQLDAISGIFSRPSSSFFEALQRILFYNQFLWQTGHKHNGLGRLDQILYPYYANDINNGRITKEKAVQLLESFFKALHDNTWYKSAMLVGDTGQIIILGGKNADDEYCCNELTYLFIEVSKKLHLPDPKVLLRCSSNMPEDLLSVAVDCISTGIGAPFLSNDDAVIPALISFGYEKDDAYNYVTSACWEPLISGNSCDQNNLCTLNFAKPLVDLFNSEELDKCTSTKEIIDKYLGFLTAYIEKTLKPLENFLFEESPLMSIVSSECLKRKKDIARGGTKYSNIGLTTVGMGSTVNSFVNIEKVVFKEKRLSLKELNEIRKNNYEGQKALQKELRKNKICYGSDYQKVVELTNRIISVTSKEFQKYHTANEGKFKFGLSSPNYIMDAVDTGATLDGRKQGEPFSVHISATIGMALTELLSFAMKMDYQDNRLNGNVVDFIVTPGFLRENKKKFIKLLYMAFSKGVYQLQMNVVDSKTLIEAQKFPDKFPNLVVRVWGFSAYFNDLPKSYQDNLIKRVIESERAA